MGCIKILFFKESPLYGTYSDETAWKKIGFFFKKNVFFDVKKMKKAGSIGYYVKVHYGQVQTEN